MVKRFSGSGNAEKCKELYTSDVDPAVGDIIEKYRDRLISGDIDIISKLLNDDRRILIESNNLKPRKIKQLLEGRASMYAQFAERTSFSKTDSGDGFKYYEYYYETDESRISVAYFSYRSTDAKEYNMRINDSKKLKKSVESIEEYRRYIQEVIIAKMNNIIS